MSLTSKKPRRRQADAREMQPSRRARGRSARRTERVDVGAWWRPGGSGRKEECCLGRDERIRRPRTNRFSWWR
eukprot:1139563-Alexandrium_andersonii.AAC.1